jgi:hypothetical protein
MQLMWESFLQKCEREVADLLPIITANAQLSEFRVIRTTTIYAVVEGDAVMWYSNRCPCRSVGDVCVAKCTWCSRIYGHATAISGACGNMMKLWVVLRTVCPVFRRWSKCYSPQAAGVLLCTEGCIAVVNARTTSGLKLAVSVVPILRPRNEMRIICWLFGI